MESVFPGAQWDRAEPQDAGMDAGALEATRLWHAERAGTEAYRVAVFRAGRIVAEWQQGMPADERRSIASARKSTLSCMLAIAVAEGKFGSADDRLIDYWPEFMDVPDGRGPKPGRFARPEDADITLRQLISNTSGYMKPGETPGKQYHYQSFGMNILSHAIAAVYGQYDSSEPDRLPGIGQVIDEKISRPIGGSWTYSTFDFEHGPGARTSIFGHAFRIMTHPRDMGRMGLLWLNRGRWQDRQVVPEDWMREATQTAPDIRANCPPEEWRYGYGFWTNDHGLLCEALPRDSFAAIGAGRNHIWVCPSLDLIVAQNPGVYGAHWDDGNCELLRRVAETCG